MSLKTIAYEREKGETPPKCFRGGETLKPYLMLYHCFRNSFLVRNKGKPSCKYADVFAWECIRIEYMRDTYPGVRWDQLNTGYYRDEIEAGLKTHGITPPGVGAP